MAGAPRNADERHGGSGGQLEEVLYGGSGGDGACATLSGAPASARAQAGAPVSYIKIGNTHDNGGLVEFDGYLTARNGSHSDTWTVRAVPGAPKGVYQLQKAGTNDCVTAAPARPAPVEPCAGNPGKSQRWAPNITPGAVTTIESRQYPGSVLTDSYGFVILGPS